MQKLAVATALIAIGLTSCATIPDVDYKYAPSTGLVTVSVVQSLACTSDGQKLYISNAQPTITTSYQADTTQAPWDIEIKEGNSQLSDSNFTFARYGDGRLKSINSVSTGQGATILKDVVSIGAADALVAGAAPGKAPGKKHSVCAELKLLNKDGVVSITYSGQFFMKDIEGNAGPQTLLEAAPGSADLFHDINDNFQRVGPIKLQLTYPNSAFDIQTAVAEGAPAAKDYYFVALQKVSVGKLEVLDQSGNSLGSAQILIPDTVKKDAWWLPIPKGQPFGNATFGISVDESGAVSQVQYVRGSGAPGVLDVLSSAVGALPQNTPSAKLADLKAQDDLIAENNRHVLCLAQRSQCK